MSSKNEQSNVRDSRTFIRDNFIDDSGVGQDYTVTERDAEQIRQICQRLDDAWKLGVPPVLETFLSDLSDELRPVMLKHVLKIDVKYRKELGESDEAIRGHYAELGLCWSPEPKLPAPAFAGRMNKRRDSKEGEFLDNYLLKSEIGRGGMGVVYLAKDLTLERLVAVKVLPGASALDEIQTRRFDNESRIAAQLQHEHIIPVYAVGKSNDVSYFAMQYVDGCDLNKKIKLIRNDIARLKLPTHRSTAEIDVTPRKSAKQTHEGKSDSRVELSSHHFKKERSSRGFSGTLELSRSVARIGVHVADALHHAHELGIIHRDVKPSNLMLDNAGKIWITDFGLAQIQGNPALTRTGMLLGTLRYMSPEQAAGNRNFVDHRTDIYSLGVTLYELLTLEPLIAGDSTEDILKNVVYRGPVSVRGIDHTVPYDLSIIIGKAVETNPVDRYATAKELSDDLNRFLAGKAIHARRPGVVKRTYQWFSRNRTIAVATAIVMFAFLVASVVAGGITLKSLQVEKAARAETEAALTESESLRLLALASLELPSNPGLALALGVKGAKGAPGEAANGLLQQALDTNHEYAQISAPAGTQHRFVVISPSGDQCVVGTTALSTDSISQPVSLRSMTDGRLIRQFDVEGLVSSAAFSSDGKWLLLTSLVSDGTSQESRPSLWKVASENQIRVFEGNTLASASDRSFHPQRPQVVLPQGNVAEVRRLDVDRIDLVLQGHDGPVRHAEFSSDGTRIITVSEDFTIRVWDTTTGSECRPPISWKPIYSALPRVGFGDASRMVHVYNGSTSWLYQADCSDETGEPVAVRQNVSLAIAGDRYIAHTLADRLLIVNARNLGRISSANFGELIQDVQFVENGETAVISGSTQVAIVDCQTGAVKARFSGHSAADKIARLATSPDGSRIATLSLEDGIRLWKSQSGAMASGLRHRVAEHQQTGDPLFDLSPDEQHVALYDRRENATTLWTSDGLEARSRCIGLLTEGTFDPENLVAVCGQMVRVTRSSTSQEIYRGYFPQTVSSNSRLLNSKTLFVQQSNGHGIFVDIATDTRVPLANDVVSVTAICEISNDVVIVAFADGAWGQIDFQSGHFLWSKQNSAPIENFSSHKSMLATIDSLGKISMWDIVNQRQLWTQQTLGDSIKLISDGQQLLVWNGVRRQVTQVLDAATGQVTLEMKLGEPARVVATHDQVPLVFLTDTEGRNDVWNLEDNTHRNIEIANVNDAVFFGDKLGLLVGQEVVRTRISPQPSSVVVLSLPSLEESGRIGLPLNGYKLRYDETSELLGVSETGRCGDVWSLVDDQLSFSLPPHPTEVVACRMLSDNSTVASVSADGMCIVSRNGQVQFRSETVGDMVIAVDFSPDADCLVYGTHSGKLVLRNIPSGIEENIPGHPTSVNCIRIGRFGQRVISVAGESGVQVWDRDTQAGMTVDIKNAVHAESTPDGKLLIVLTTEAGRQTEGWFLNLDTNERKILSPQTRFATFSDDGSLYGVLLPDGELEIYDCKTANKINSIKGEFSSARRFAFSPDNKTLAVDCEIELKCVDVNSGQLLNAMPMQDSYQRSARWTPFASGSSDKVFCSHGSVVQSRLVTPLAKAQEVARELTDKERQRYRVDFAGVRKF